MEIPGTLASFAKIISKLLKPAIKNDREYLRELFRSVRILNPDFQLKSPVDIFCNLNF